MAIEAVQLTVPTPSTRNYHRVNAKQWRKWSPLARRVFNTHYKTLRENQSLIAPPTLARIPGRPWAVLAWNSAWLAADAIDGR